MRDGVIHQYDSPQETYDHPVDQFVAGFIGSPAMNFLQAQVSSDNGGVALTGEGFRLVLPAGDAEELPGQVVVGIRPEDLDGPVTEGKNTLEMSVAVTEPLGNELLVYADCGGERVVANLDPHRRVEVDSIIKLKVNTETVHLFDQATEQTLL